MNNSYTSYNRYSPYDVDRSLSKKRLLKFVDFRSHLRQLLKIKSNVSNVSNVSETQLLLDIQTELLWFHNEYERYNKTDQQQFLQLVISLIYEAFPHISKENKPKLYDLHRQVYSLNIFIHSFARFS